MNDLRYFVVQGRGAASFVAKGGDGPVDGIYLGLFPFLDVLQHAGFQLGVFPDGNGQYQQGEAFFQGTVVIQQFHGILSLHGLNLDAGMAAHVYAFLDKAQDNPAGSHRFGGLSESASQHGAHAGKGRVDEKLAPSRANKIGLYVYLSHAFQQGFHLGQVGMGSGGDGAQGEGQAVRGAGELANAGGDEGGAPGYGAAQHPVGADDIGNSFFREAVLQGYQHAVIGKKRLQEGDHFRIALLFGKEEDDVVLSLHFFGQEGAYALGEFQGAGDAGADGFERGHVGLVMVDEVNFFSASGDEGAQDGA